MPAKIGHRFLQPHWLHALLAGGALAGLAPSGALAAPVPDNTDLYILAPTPIDGTVWDIGLGTTASGPITLPLLVTTGLTINGQSAVSSVTLTNGTTYGRFNRLATPTGAVMFSLSNVELTGGNQTTGSVSGGAINVLSGALTIPASGTVRFKGNTASGNGGAVYVSGAAADQFLLDGNPTSTIEFIDNRSTTNGGGAISAFPKVTINGGDITITGNTAQGTAGAIAASTGAGDVTLNAVNTVTLSNNHTDTNVGGAIRAVGVVTIKGKVVDISNDSSDSGNTYGNGGAIWSSKMGSSANLNPSVVIDGEQITLANNKNLHAQGGAIFSRGSVAIGSDPLTASVKLNDNHSGSAGDNTGTGGAIDAYGSAVTVADQIAVTILGKDIEIARNSTGANMGGAIYVVGSVLIGNGNTDTVMVSDDHDDKGWGGALFGNYVQIDGKDITLTRNQATNSGGAIYVAKNGSALVGNAASTVTLSNNSATYGGAIYVDTGDVTVLGSQINLAGNDTTGGNVALLRTANTAFDTSSIDPERDGDSNGRVIAVGDPLVKFTRAGNYGGAIYGVNVNIGNPGGGSVLALTGNKAMYGGAIVADSAATLTGQGSISGNKADYGGAILSFGDVTLTATYGDMTFSGNTGNAIWLENANPSTGAPLGTPAKATFNADTGNIIFGDHIANDTTNGLITVTANGPGAVVFAGAGNVSQVYGATTVASGTLRVQNGAVYGALAGGLTNPTSFTVPTGATLTGGGTGTVRADQFVLRGTLNVAGAAAPGTAAGGFSTFNIISGNGASAGSIDLNGGQLVVNTCLNNAGAQLSDVLNLTAGKAGSTNGTITGTLGLTINQVTGPGCEGSATTFGSGILLVQADVPSAGLFGGLAGTVVATSSGGHGYKLVNAGNNWYLQTISVQAGGGAAAIPTLDPAHLAALALLLAMLTAAVRRKG